MGPKKISTFGERIKERRKQLGMNAETLAGKIGKSPSTIYRYESGDISNVDSRSLEPIADALHTTPGYLMGWDEEPGNASAFAERLGLIMAVRGRSVEEVAEVIGAEPDDVHRMISSDLDPSYDQFQALAEYLNVTDDCLAGKTDIGIVERNADPLKAELSAIYDRLNDAGRDILMGTARGLVANPEMKKGSASKDATA